MTSCSGFTSIPRLHHAHIFVCKTVPFLWERTYQYLVRVDLLHSSYQSSFIPHSSRNSNVFLFIFDIFFNFAVHCMSLMKIVWQKTKMHCSRLPIKIKARQHNFIVMVLINGGCRRLYSNNEQHCLHFVRKSWKHVTFRNASLVTRAFIWLRKRVQDHFNARLLMSYWCLPRMYGKNNCKV